MIMIFIYDLFLSGLFLPASLFLFLCVSPYRLGQLAHTVATTYEAHVDTRCAHIHWGICFEDMVEIAYCFPPKQLATILRVLATGPRQGTR